MAYTASQIQANRDNLARIKANRANSKVTQQTSKPVAIKTSTGISKLPTNNQTIKPSQPAKMTPTQARVGAVLEKGLPTAQTNRYDKTLKTVWEGGVEKTNPDYIPNAQKISIKNEREQMLRDKYYGDVQMGNKYINQSQQSLANRQAGIQGLADLNASKIEEADRKQRRYAKDQISDVKDLANQSIEAQNIAREQSQANYDKATGIAEEDRQSNRIRALRRIASSNIAGGSTAMSMQQEVDKTFNDTIGQLTEDQNFNERLIANAVSTINTNANKEIRAINESLLSPVQKQQAIQQIRLEAQNKGFELEDLAIQRQQEAERYTSQQYGQTLDKVLTMRDTQEVRAEDKRRYEQGQMSAQEQRNYERNQDALNQKLKGLEYLINSTPYGQSVQVPRELQQALGLPSTIRGGDNTMIDNAIKNQQLQSGMLDYQGKELDIAKQRGELGLVSVIPGQSGNRPDRNNNPGNLKVGGKTDSGGFTIFDTPEAGFQAMIQDITAKLTGNSPATRAKLGRDAQTLLDVISVYAPKGDGNDPVNYAKSVASQLGINNINVSVGELVPRVQELAKAMARHEGFTGDIMIGNSQTGEVLGTTGNAQIDTNVEGYATKKIAGTGGLTQAAIDKAALQYAMTGSMPSLGLGSSTDTQNKRNAIQARAAELDQNGTISANKANLQALTSSLSKQTEYKNTIERSINTVDKNLDLLFSAANKVNNSQSPLVNEWSNLLKTKAIGSGDLAAYKAAIATVRAEYSQILSRGGQVTDSVRKEAETLIPDNITKSQLADVINMLKAESSNVKSEANNTVDSIQQELNNIIGGGNLYKPKTKVYTPGIQYSKPAGPEKPTKISNEILNLRSKYQY